MVAVNIINFNALKSNGPLRKENGGNQSKKNNLKVQYAVKMFD
jgi:hypothetical protein